MFAKSHLVNFRIDSTLINIGTKENCDAKNFNVLHLAKVTYTKHKEGIVKKANELSILCDTDVGLIMFLLSRALFLLQTMESLVCVRA